MTLNLNRLLISHFLMPFFALVMISITIAVGDIDRIIADYWYAIQGNSWAWKNSFIAEMVFHKGGRNLSLFFALTTLTLFLTSYFHKPLAALKKPLLYLFLAA